MRIVERLMYGLGVLLCIVLIYQKHTDSLTHRLSVIIDDTIVSSIVVTALVGAFYEGIRLQQYLFLVACSV